MGNTHEKKETTQNKKQSTDKNTVRNIRQQSIYYKNIKIVQSLENQLYIDLS